MQNKYGDDTPISFYKVYIAICFHIKIFRLIKYNKWLCMMASVYHLLSRPVKDHKLEGELYKASHPGRQFT